MCWISPSPFPQLHVAAQAHHVLLCLHVLAHICPSPIPYQNHTFQETKKPGRRTDYMSVKNQQVCNESSFATNSRGSNYPSGNNKISHLLPERNCNQMPKTLAQRFFWMWITLSGEVKVSLSNLPSCYKKPWKLQHSIILQGKKADLKRLICTLQMVHTKKKSKWQRRQRPRKCSCPCG